MKTFIALMLALLVGCGHTPVKPEAPVVKETKYIVRTPDAKLLTLPTPVPNIDVDLASQAEVAEWILNKESYTNSVENKLIGVAKFLKDEQAKADADAKKE